MDCRKETLAKASWDIYIDIFEEKIINKVK